MKVPSGTKGTMQFMSTPITKTHMSIRLRIESSIWTLSSSRRFQGESFRSPYTWQIKGKPLIEEKGL